jgi:transcriptional regulator with XRE-family HTH domain
LTNAKTVARTLLFSTGASVEDLANATGYSEGYLWEILSGRRNPSARVRTAIADYLAMDVDLVFPEFEQSLRNSGHVPSQDTIDEFFFLIREKKLSIAKAARACGQSPRWGYQVSVETPQEDVEVGA